MSKTACIVDAYSTGTDLPWRFKREGYRVIHVANDIDAPNLTSSLDASCIDETYQLCDYGKKEELFKFLKEEELTHVLPGTETGIELSDEIAHYFELPGNSVETSINRRNKTKMQATLANSSLNHIMGIAVESYEELALKNTTQIRFPCVVKPEESAGADDVFFCSDSKSVEIAIKKIVGSKNQIGGINARALVQEQLIGVQYFVNAISINGNHSITEIWEDSKTTTGDGRVVCDREKLLCSNGRIQLDIKRYVMDSLTALNIENGASHSELIFTERGPIIIEIAARMQGTILPKAVEAALGFSHPSLLVESTINPVKFSENWGTDYIKKKNLNVVTLISAIEGVVEKSYAYDLLKTLRSFYGVIHMPSVGDYINRTVDLFTNPGTIYLCSEENEIIESDYNMIRKWEMEGVFFKIR